ncbi:MAG TPA: hypothetical protein VH143_22175 [Kofleriaceae bacterium]|nr:hypothetical protein [Kofleriaceae bacterium]
MRWITAALVLAACTHDHNIIVGSGSSSNDMVIKQFPTSPDLDVLFMVDNSSSTADKQEIFAAAFPTFVAAIDNFPGGRPNLHIGVISSTADLGPDAAALSPICGSTDSNDGRLQNTAGSGCPSGAFIEDIADGSGRDVNYTGTLEDALSCIAPVGDTGCGFEAQMLATQRALDGTHPENAGFLRADADLMIVMLTDEDDCSVIDSSLFTVPSATVGGVSDFRCQPLTAYDCDTAITAVSGSATYTNCSVHHGGPLLDPDIVAQLLATIKDPSQTAVALIAGDPQTTIMTGEVTFASETQDPALLPSCSTTLDDGPAIGRPAIRLNDFMSHYGPRGSFHSVCQPDYGQALTDIAGSMSTMLTSTCLASNVDPTDTDSAMPGVQLACTATDNLDYPNGQTISIPQCAMTDVTLPDPNGARPCFWAQTDESCTSQGGSTLSYHVERATPAPAGTLVSIACQPAH